MISLLLKVMGHLVISRPTFEQKLEKYEISFIKKVEGSSVVISMRALARQGRSTV